MKACTRDLPVMSFLNFQKPGSKLTIEKTRIMASGPITSWQRDGETVRYFIWGGSKITADGDCSHEITRLLLLERKQPRQNIKKQRHYFLTKLRLVKAMVFPVVMYECEIWTVKIAEHLKLMLLNCGVGEDSCESLGLQGDQSWVFTGRTDAETPILWPPHVKS